MSMFYCAKHQRLEDADYVGFNSCVADYFSCYCDDAWAELYPDPWTVHGVTEYPGVHGSWGKGTPTGQSDN